MPWLGRARQFARELEALKSDISRATGDWDKVGIKREETLGHALKVIYEEDHRALPKKLRARKKMSKAVLGKMVERVRFMRKELSSKRKYLALLPFRDAIAEEKRIGEELNTLYPKARAKLAELTDARRSVEADGKAPSESEAPSEPEGTPSESEAPNELRRKRTFIEPPTPIFGEESPVGKSPFIAPPIVAEESPFIAPPILVRARGRGKTVRTAPVTTAPVHPMKNPGATTVGTKKYLGFVGNWDVVCGDFKFRVIVSPLGNVSMFRDDASWSVHNIPMTQIGASLSLTIDEVEWRLAKTEGRDVAKWTSPTLPGHLSIWTREAAGTPRSDTRAAGRPKTQAKPAQVQKPQAKKTGTARLSPTMPPSQAFSATSSGSQPDLSSRPGYFYTEVRGDRLVWTDGSSQAAGDMQDIQKSKMQF